METALWILVFVVAYFGYAIANLLRSIDGKLNGIRGQLSSDGPDPGFTSYLRMSAGSLSAIKAVLDEEKARRDRS